jgi:hypothetical protein
VAPFGLTVPLRSAAVEPVNRGANVVTAGAGTAPATAPRLSSPAAQRPVEAHEIDTNVWPGSIVENDQAGKAASALVELSAWPASLTATHRLVVHEIALSV